jgi:hypothetical protein
MASSQLFVMLYSQLFLKELFEPPPIDQGGIPPYG